MEVKSEKNKTHVLCCLTDEKGGIMPNSKKY